MKAVKIHNTSSRYPALSSFRIAVDLTLSHLCVRLRYLNFSSPLGSGEGTLVAIVYSCFVADNLYFSLLYLLAVRILHVTWIACLVSFFLFCLLNFL